MNGTVVVWDNGYLHYAFKFRGAYTLDVRELCNKRSESDSVSETLRPRKEKQYQKRKFPIGSIFIWTMK